MSELNKKIPIGLLLQNAGLISAEQLKNALEVQKQYPQMKLGEILVLRQGLRVKTINFFADKWQEIMAQGQILPLGYYLKQACLLNDQQIATILQEQKEKQEKFGEIAVQKDWIEQDTINFFINNLSLQPPQIMSLGMLEKYNSETLHLEKKYADHSLVLTRILAWTGGIPVLTKAIAQVFAKSKSNIPGGQEIKAVDQFVEGTLIRKWRTDNAASSIRTIAYSLSNNPRCGSIPLLKEYQNILLAVEKAYENSEEQQELLQLGLIVLVKNQLRVSSIIYQQIFDREFVIEKLQQLESKKVNSANSKSTSQQSETQIPEQPQSKILQSANIATVPAESIAQTPLADKQEYPIVELEDNSPEPLTKVASIITGVAIALLVPLFLTINNYYSSLSNSSGKTKNISQKQTDQLQQSCRQINSPDLSSVLNAIANLESTQQQLQQDFPANCEITLNRLRVMAAPQLGKESRILEAIRHLCKVPSSSEMYIEAEVWLKRWYRSANWGQETKFYLEEIDKYENVSCPPAHFTEYEI
ncbi:MAG: hypothetical protein AAFO95_08945 [Cyanobacteria bacterium J06600_6]